MKGMELLKALSLAFGPSGCEKCVADIIKKEVLPHADLVTTDRLGSLLVLYKGTGAVRESSMVPHRLMLAAHMDEVGFMIRSVDDKGLAYPAHLSIGDGKVLTGRSVTVGNEDGQVDGFMGAVPAHKSGGSTDFGSLYVDIGAKNKDEALAHVKPGDFGVFRTEFEVLGGADPLWKGKAIDDRLGCAVLCDVLAELAQSGYRPPFDTWFCFTCREEIGASTATTAAYAVDPDVGIVLEATAVADVHGTDEPFRSGDQGKGPLVSLIDGGTIYPRDLANFLLDLGEREQIPVQTKRFFGGYNDAKYITKTHAGAKVAAISAPTRYIHSAACAVRESDYNGMVKLVLAAVKNI